MSHHIVAYYILSLTWGIFMTTIGILTGIFLLIIGKKPYIYKCAIYFDIPVNKAISLGPVVLCSRDLSDDLKNHVLGHSIQNCIWGPLFPIVILIPSAIRHYIRSVKTLKYKRKAAIIITLVISMIGLVVTVLQHPILLISGCSVVAYGRLLNRWLLKTEIPKYTQDVSYEDIWFERNATTLGSNLLK